VFFSVTGTILWVGSLTLAGYYFGSLPFVKQNLSAVILGIVAVSLLPATIEFLRQHLAARRARATGERL
jgi:membrane-associated protein